MTRVFAMPAVIALATVAGLIVALAGDGWRDALGWLGLATPIAVTVWAMRARRT